VILVPIIALLIGVALPLFFGLAPIAGVSGQYLAVACLAGLDSVCGGIRAGLEGKFHNDVFATGFVSNTVIAFFLAWLGDRIGINLVLAAVVVLGARVFTNLSLIRRYALTRWQDRQQRIRLRQRSEQQSNA
jgi:small basic protein